MLNLIKYDNLKIIIIIIILILIYIFILNPYLEKQNINEKFQITEEFENLQNIINNPLKVYQVDKNICSKQCCKFEQWPIPFNTVNPNIDKKILNNFIGTNLSCNNGPDGGGCLCMTKDDFNYIANRGQSISNKYNNPVPFDIKNIVDNSIISAGYSKNYTPYSSNSVVENNIPISSNIQEFFNMPNLSNITASTDSFNIPNSSINTFGNMEDLPMNENIYDSSINENIYDSSINENIYNSPINENIYDSSMNENIYDSSMNENIYDSSMNENIYDLSINENIPDSSNII